MKGISKQTLVLLLSAGVFFSGHTVALNKGQLLYQKACQLCHQGSKAKAMKAPMAFDKKVWQKRVQDAKKAIAENKRFKSVDDYFLYQIKIGRGLMHHGGLCHESKGLDKSLDCSDQSYLEAIAYMREGKPKK